MLVLMAVLSVTLVVTSLMTFACFYFVCAQLTRRVRRLRRTVDALEGRFNTMSGDLDELETRQRRILRAGKPSGVN